MPSWLATTRRRPALSSESPNSRGRTALCFALISALAVAAQAQAPAHSLKIYIAASTKEPVEKIAARFAQSLGVEVEVTPGSSSKLAKQIVEGAPADLFLSADPANADYLSEKNLVAKSRNLLGNRLVVVTPADSSVAIHSLVDLGGDQVREVALALQGVPAGEYGREALRNAGVWDRVQSKVVGGEDVRATLAFVERGAAAGIVYLTDTFGNAKVRVALEIDPALHHPIEYPLVLLRHEPGSPDAARLYEHLASEASAATFRAAGFTVLP